MSTQDPVLFEHTPAQFIGVVFQTITNLITGAVTSIGYVPIGVFKMIQSEFLRHFVTTLISSILNLILNVVVALTTEISGLITSVLSILRLVNTIVNFINNAGLLVTDWVLKLARLLMQFLIDLIQSLT